MNINEKKLRNVLRNGIGINMNEKMPEILAALEEISSGAENVVHVLAAHGAPYAKVARYSQRSQVLPVGDVLIGLAVVALDRTNADIRINHDGLTVDFKEGWAAEASLRVDFRSTGNEVELADGSMARLVASQIQVSWSSTHRSLSETAVALRVYQQALELGQLIEMVLGRIQYISA